MNQAIVIDGVNITPQIVKGLQKLRENTSVKDMKENITRILFMLGMNQDARDSEYFEDGVFMLQVLYDISDSIFEAEGGENG